MKYGLLVSKSRQDRNYSLTPWSRNFLEKIRISMLIKKFLILWNQKVSYYVCKSQSWHPIPSLLNLVQNLTCYLFKKHLNVNFLSKNISSKWPHSLIFCNQNFVCISRLPHACYIFSPSHAYWFGFNHHKPLSDELSEKLLVSEFLHTCCLLSLI